MPRKVQWSQLWRNSRNCVSKDISLNDKNNTNKTMADIDIQLTDREGWGVHPRGARLQFFFIFLGPVGFSIS